MIERHSDVELARLRGIDTRAIVEESGLFRPPEREVRELGEWQASPFAFPYVTQIWAAAAN
jgi:hypothetical protein